MKDMRLYYYDESGRALYYVQIKYLEYLKEYRFTHSLYLKIEKMAKYSEICQSLLVNDINWRQRTSRLNKLGLLIKNDPIFIPHYFPEIMLTANGQYNDYHEDRFIDELTNDKDFPNFALFSADDNPLYFYMVKRYFYGHVITEPEHISREQFLEIIKNHHNIQCKYVDFLGPENLFYKTHSHEEKGVIYDIYFMTSMENLHFFFIRQRPTSTD